MVSAGSAGAVRDKKQAMGELKLKRLNDLNGRLKEDLNRSRVRTSEACESIAQYATNTKDFMVPTQWGTIDKNDDPYSPPSESGCCIIL
ncbi:GGL domain-containing protein [Dipodascopsis uninucleata]